MKRPAVALGAVALVLALGSVSALGLGSVSVSVSVSGLVNRNMVKSYYNREHILALFLLVMVDRPQCRKASKQARPSLFVRLTECPSR